MDIEFHKITEFSRGTLANLLKDGYSFEPRFYMFCQMAQMSYLSARRQDEAMRWHRESSQCGRWKFG